MEAELLQKQYKMLAHLSGLPRKILSLDHQHNITEFILHDLCQESCFDLSKVAYFIDNPDFNCTRGVAGFSREEDCALSSIWDDVDAFTHHMKQSKFNEHVRGVARCSLKNIEDMHQQLAQEIASTLGFKNHAYCSWNMRHGNEGFVVYEKASAHNSFADDYMINGLSILSFCPIFY